MRDLRKIAWIAAAAAVAAWTAACAMPQNEPDAEEQSVQKAPVASESAAGAADFPARAAQLAPEASAREAAEKGKNIREDVIVRMAIDKTAYRPGEAVVATVEVENASDRPLRLRELSNDQMMGHAVEFLYGLASDTLRVRRFPVYSMLEKVGKEQDVPPGEKFRRPLVLTRVTEKPGKYFMLAQYTPQHPPMPEMGEKGSAGRTMSKAFSAPVAYEVAGDRLYHRDKNGILLKDDAINLCLARLGRRASDSQASLVIDRDRGALVWWVCLTTSPESLAAGEARKKAWLVNPYTARVIGETFTQLQLQGKSLTENIEYRTPKAAQSMPAEAE